jgi:hypothetical protein
MEMGETRFPISMLKVPYVLFEEGPEGVPLFSRIFHVACRTGQLVDSGYFVFVFEGVMLFCENFFEGVFGGVCNFYSCVLEDFCYSSGLFAEVCEFRPVCFLCSNFLSLGAGN